VLTGIGKTLNGRFIRYDALNMETRELKLRKDPECPVCSANPSITALIDYEQFCGLTRGDDGSGVDIKRMNVDDYADMRDDGIEHLLLDVREEHELKICELEHNVHIPLGQLPQRLDEIKDWQDKPVIVLCKSGQRSLKAAETLLKHGFADVSNLEGGIIAWSEEIDNSLPVY
jgi:adenylyltransferase/sulfurtransferase